MVLDELYDIDRETHKLVNQAILVLERNGPAEGRPLVDTITSSSTSNPLSEHLQFLANCCQPLINLCLDRVFALLLPLQLLNLLSKLIPVPGILDGYALKFFGAFLYPFFIGNFGSSLHQLGPQPDNGCFCPLLQALLDHCSHPLNAPSKLIQLWICGSDHMSSGLLCPFTLLL